MSDLPERVCSLITIGDLVERVNDRRTDPVADGLTKFVGVDHLDSNDLTLRRWGETEDSTLPPTFRFAFPTGSVLFPTRRPLLCKCAIAPFDGVTGEKILILKSIDRRRLDPLYMRFLLASPAVRSWVVDRAIGSVTPHFRWRDLAEFEFALPPLDEQRRIAEALQAAETYQDALHDLLENAASSYDSLVDHQMRGVELGDPDYHERVGPYFGNWSLVPLGELLTSAQYGLSESLHSSGRYPVLRMMNLKDGKVTVDDLKYLDLPGSEFETYRLMPGDVLFNRTNSYELVGRTGLYDLPGDHVFASYLIRLKTKTNRLMPAYLCSYLRAPIGRRQIMSFATRGVSQTNVNASNLKRILIPVPPLGYQEGVVDLLGAVDSARRETQKRLQEAKSFSTKIYVGGTVG
jgi:type I restriction enzyme, S subunit